VVLKGVLVYLALLGAIAFTLVVDASVKSNFEPRARQWEARVALCEDAMLRRRMAEQAVLGREGTGGTYDFYTYMLGISALSTIDKGTATQNLTFDVERFCNF
jgi:hypothetical protein